MESGCESHCQCKVVETERPIYAQGKPLLFYLCGIKTPAWFGSKKIPSEMEVALLHNPFAP